MWSNARMNYFGMQLILCLLAAVPLLARAGGDEVVVVYNSRMPESKAVAEHYARLRQVPEKQIYGFELTTNEVMSRAEFHDSLQMPLAKKLEKDGLWKFEMTFYKGTNNAAGPGRAQGGRLQNPLRRFVLRRAAENRAEPEHLTKPDAEKMQPELRRNEAAVDSELAWLPLLQMEFPLTGPFPNWLYGATNSAMFNPTNGFLLVARLDGPTPEIARGLVDKALAAERDGLVGPRLF